MLNSGCAFYCTSCVKHIGARTLEPTKTFQSSDIICVEARLVQWKYNDKRVDLGNRLIIISRDALTKDIIEHKSEIEKYTDENNLGVYQLYKIPVIVDWQEEKVDFNTANKWYLYPDNLYEILPDSALDDFKKNIKLASDLAKNQRFIFNNGDIHCSVDFNFERPYYKPLRSNLLKSILYLPAVTIDCATLPLIVIGYPVMWILYCSGGPGP